MLFINNIRSAGMYASIHVKSDKLGSCILLNLLEKLFLVVADLNLHLVSQLIDN